MVEITVPKIKTISNYIQIEDLEIAPEYIEDHTYDPTYYNEHNVPIQRMQTKVYSKGAYELLKKEREWAASEYKNWLDSAPYFVKIN